MRFARRHSLAHLFAIMFRAMLLTLPMHAGAATVVDLHAISPDVALAGLRVLGDDRGQRDESPPVQWPALQDGKIQQREIVALDDFLTWPTRDFLGEEFSHLGEHRQ